MHPDATGKLGEGNGPAAAAGSGLLSEEIALFLQSGLGIVIGVVGSDGRARTGRALAVRIVGPDVIRVIYPAEGNAAVISTALAGGAIAVTLSAPLTNRTIQVKSSACMAEPVTAEDSAATGLQSDAFGDVLAAIGYTPAFVSAFCAISTSELCALSLSVEAAFEQTPGPGAGRSI